ncbi:NAD(P)-binding domain-containing protein [Alphaproteobacteria bacterium]|nr:NAD(P)-dependent oxidoreductase [Alphaproteobacteria bacterium]MDC3270329.1 NAD(P)-binding domain-containing protein [Alphaproteobacteria bacterium]
MNIFFFATYSNQEEFLLTLKKKFKHDKIFTISDDIDLSKIDVAMVWNLPSNIFKKMVNLKAIFSIGAGVDHILKLPNIRNLPIIRVKDPTMRIRMYNHVLSQILIFQLKLKIYDEAQRKNIWVNERYTPLNNELTIGIMGLGYIGNFVALNIKKLGYNVIGFKRNKTTTNTPFEIYNKSSLNKFIKRSDIIVSILPDTKNTKNFVNANFLKKMKKSSLLINIGRGPAVNEVDLIKHIKINPNFFASLDVFNREPLIKKHKFWSNKNITITPHVAAITDHDSSIGYLYERFMDFKKNKKIKSDVDIKLGY